MLSARNLFFETTFKALLVTASNAFCFRGTSHGETIIQTSYHVKVPHWYATHPSTEYKENWLASSDQLRPVVVRFHQVAALLLVTLMSLSVGMWLLMRLIYPQPLSHQDDLSGYEALLPGENTNPVDFGFQLLDCACGISEPKLNYEQPTTYIKRVHFQQVVLLDTPYQQKQIARFTLYSKTLQLLDLLWRWGRPTSTERDIPNKHWDVVWLTDELTISVFIQRLNINAAVSGVWIVLN